MEWTTEQKNAIEAEGCSLLVSAAAGAGKTAVLTERVAQKLLDRENGCAPEELLVVTFTNAAAAEMRIRIFDKVANAAAAHPGDPFYTSLRARMDNANICTIDSFCIRLVREHFHEAGISPDFRLLDDGENRLLLKKTVYAVIEQLHGEKNAAFEELCALFEQGRDDEQLADSILRLHEYCVAYPFADVWLEGVLSCYEDGDPLQTAWGKLLMQQLQDGLRYCISLYDRSLLEIVGEQDLMQKFDSFLRNEKQMFESVLAACDKGWDAACDALFGVQYEGFPRISKPADPELKNAVKARRDYCKKEMERLASLCPATLEEHKEDMLVLRPVVAALLDAVRLFSKELRAAKAEMNAYDFSDITAAALSLLVYMQDGQVCRTELARELSASYREILVDEYQDTNEAQDMLFRALSRNEENLFMVGDVKQSIYKFRLAMPEIFLHKAESFQLYNGDKLPSKIILGCNFRSRKGVVDAVNFVFSRIMTKQAGEIAYTKEEELVFAAEYPENPSPDAEWHILEAAGKNRENTLREEARFVGRHILSCLAAGQRVRTKNGQRKAHYGDFCILLRTVKGIAEIFTEELSAMGIPSACEKSGDFFENAEIRTVLSLLRVIDNPYSDIDTVAVLYSSLYGFTSDEIAQLRAKDRYAPVYVCLQKMAQDGAEKAEAFLSDCTFLRDTAVGGSVSLLLREIYDRTGLRSVVSAMPDGDIRRRNLLVLLEYATAFDENIGGGLYGFLRYIDELQENGQKLNGAGAAASDGGFVRIMSIHKSKGLEFPFVFLADTAKAFNRQDKQKNLILSHQLGVGLCRQDRATLRKFDTVSSAAVKLAQTRGANAEEMRLLYVAMTRAAERLIILTSLHKAEEKCAQAACFLPDSLVPNPYAMAQANSFADWLVPVLLTHPDAKQLRSFSSANTQALSPMLVQLHDACEQYREEQQAQIPSQPQEDLLQLIKSKADTPYAYAVLDGVPVKRTASDLYAEKFNTDFFASSVPAFLCADSLTPAEKGTAVHKFLQYCSLDADAPPAAEQAEQMCRLGRLTRRELQAIDFTKTQAFLLSPTAERARRSQKLLREMQFTLAVPAGEFAEELDGIAAAETTVVIGKIDMVFVEDGQAVIVDYKTDRVKKAEDLTQRYMTQLQMYARAAEELLDLPVREAVLYSIHLGETVHIPIDGKKN